MVEQATYAAYVRVRSLCDEDSLAFRHLTPFYRANYWSKEVWKYGHLPLFRDRLLTQLNKLLSPSFAHRAASSLALLGMALRHISFTDGAVKMVARVRVCACACMFPTH